MRKKHIKSVAHWVIMCFVLLFPIVLVGVSSFAKEENQTEVNIQYKYETNEVNTLEDIISGNIYYFEFPYTSSDSYLYAGGFDFVRFNCIYLDEFNFSNFEDLYIDEFYSEQFVLGNMYYSFMFSGDMSFYCQVYSENIGDYIISLGFDTSSDSISFYFSGYFQVLFDDMPFVHDALEYISICPQEYIPFETVEVNEVTSTMRQDINNWTNDFVNLPVNAWYGSLLTAIGINLTANSLMRVLYVYPLYVIWVYILDLVVDLLLVIVKLGHNALQKLGGENE